MFHVPIRGVLEWATIEDSGRLLLNVCKDDVPEFWLDSTTSAAATVQTHQLSV